MILAVWCALIALGLGVMLVRILNPRQNPRPALLRLTRDPLPDTDADSAAWPYEPGRLRAAALGGLRCLPRAGHRRYRDCDRVIAAAALHAAPLRATGQPVIRRFRPY